MKSYRTSRVFLLAAVAALSLIAASAHAANPPDPPRSDYQAKLDIIGAQLEAQNERESAQLTSCNGIAEKLLAATGKCTSDLCVVMVVQETGKLRCAGGGAAAAASSTAPQIAIPDPPPPPVPFLEKLGNGLAWGIGKLVDGAIQVAPVFANLKLGIVQSNNNRDLGIVQSNNTTAATISTNQSFVAMNNGTVRLGQTGFRTGARTARDAFNALGKPNTVITVNGDCNGVNVGQGSAAPSCDRTTTTTTTTTTTDNSDRSTRSGAP